MITEDAVLAAIAECDALGRDAFLRTYGFDPAREYVLIHDGVYYDSKAVVGVAYRYVAGRPLRAREFSGGRQTVARLLERLGFEVAVNPGAPRLVARLRQLRTASTPDGPARHQPLLLLWAMGRARRRLPRLVHWSQARIELGELLRVHGRPASRPRADYPFLALAGTHLWELRGHTGPVPAAHGDAAPLRWLDEHDPAGGLTAWAYELVAGSATARDAAVAVLLDRFFDPEETARLLRDVHLAEPSDGEHADTEPAETYRRLVEAVEEGERRGDDRRVTRTSRESPVRSAQARRAVLVRSDGRCENPGCEGQPTDVADDGSALLEVDHVDDRAGGGRDHPVLMIALCPNCHAVKTRGRSREALREILRAEARQRHSAWAELWPAPPAPA